MSMSWKLRTVSSIFTNIDQNYPFRHLDTSAVLSIPSRSSLAFYFPSPGLQISPLPAASWLGWGIRRRAGAPCAFTEIFSSRRWGEGSLMMRVLCGAALTTWLGPLKIRRSHSSWNGEVSPFSTGTPPGFRWHIRKWAGGMNLVTGWSGCSWTRYGHFHTPKNSCAKLGHHEVKFGCSLGCWVPALRPL